MKASLRKSRPGRTTRWSGWNTLLLSFGGLLMFFLLFRGKGSPSQVITRVLRDSGYSSNFAKWWVAISNHETGRWTSDLFLNANNLFGMKQPSQRATYSVGPYKGYASFNSLDDSVKDLVLYLQEFNYPNSFSSVDELVNFMKSKGYFEDTVDRYLKSVKARL